MAKIPKTGKSKSSAKKGRPSPKPMPMRGTTTARPTLMKGYK